jgi:regulator of sigma E protease
VKDPFGNTQRLGILGITRATSPGSNTGKSSSQRALAKIKTGSSSARRCLYRQHLHGRASADQIRMHSDRADLGRSPPWDYPLLHLAAVLSISIGLLNLFPVPLLDGGHLLFYTAEVLRGRPLSEKSQEYGFRVGLVLVLMLMVFAFYNDFHQVPWLKGLFGRS